MAEPASGAVVTLSTTPNVIKSTGTVPFDSQAGDGRDTSLYHMPCLRE